ncbi:hypothetical protein CLOP_g7342 [Closterium sp. NIES-67]|nr:hypothetical protein CLOP_g7342 [Closterium sp. NIES-67]
MDLATGASWHCPAAATCRSRNAARLVGQTPHSSLARSPSGAAPLRAGYRAYQQPFIQGPVQGTSLSPRSLNGFLIGQSSPDDLRCSHHWRGRQLGLVTIHLVTQDSGISRFERRRGLYRRVASYPNPFRFSSQRRVPYAIQGAGSPGPRKCQLIANAVAGPGDYSRNGRNSPGRSTVGGGSSTGYGLRPAASGLGNGYGSSCSGRSGGGGSSSSGDGDDGGSYTVRESGRLGSGSGIGGSDNGRNGGEAPHQSQQQRHWHQEQQRQQQQQQGRQQGRQQEERRAEGAGEQGKVEGSAQVSVQGKVQDSVQGKVEGSVELEVAIFEFMLAHGHPDRFPTRHELLAAGRQDLVEACLADGGWLSAGWEVGVAGEGDAGKGGGVKVDGGGDEAEVTGAGGRSVGQGRFRVQRSVGRGGHGGWRDDRESRESQLGQWAGSQWGSSGQTSSFVQRNQQHAEQVDDADVDLDSGFWSAMLSPPSQPIPPPSPRITPPAAGGREQAWAEGRSAGEGGLREGRAKSRGVGMGGEGGEGGEGGGGREGWKEGGRTGSMSAGGVRRSDLRGAGVKGRGTGTGAADWRADVLPGLDTPVDPTPGIPPAPAPAPPYDSPPSAAPPVSSLDSLSEPLSWALEASNEDASSGSEGEGGSSSEWDASSSEEEDEFAPDEERVSVSTSEQGGESSGEGTVSLSKENNTPPSATPPSATSPGAVRGAQMRLSSLFQQLGLPAIEWNPGTRGLSSAQGGQGGAIESTQKQQLGLPAIEWDPGTRGLGSELGGQGSTDGSLGRKLAKGSLPEVQEGTKGAGVGSESEGEADGAGGGVDSGLGRIAGGEGKSGGEAGVAERAGERARRGGGRRGYVSGEEGEKRKRRRRRPSGKRRKVEEIQPVDLLVLRQQLQEFSNAAGHPGIMPTQEQLKHAGRGDLAAALRQLAREQAGGDAGRSGQGREEGGETGGEGAQGGEASGQGGGTAGARIGRQETGVGKTGSGGNAAPGSEEGAREGEEGRALGRARGWSEVARLMGLGRRRRGRAASGEDGGVDGAVDGAVAGGVGGVVPDLPEESVVTSSPVKPRRPVGRPRKGPSSVQAAADETGRGGAEEPGVGSSTGGGRSEWWKGMGEEGETGRGAAQEPGVASSFGGGLVEGVRVNDGGGKARRLKEEEEKERGRVDDGSVVEGRVAEGSVAEGSVVEGSMGGVGNLDGFDAALSASLANLMAFRKRLQSLEGWDGRAAAGGAAARPAQDPARPAADEPAENLITPPLQAQITPASQAQPAPVGKEEVAPSPEGPAPGAPAPDAPASRKRRRRVTRKRSEGKARKKEDAGMGAADTDARDVAGAAGSAAAGASADAATAAGGAVADAPIAGAAGAAGDLSAAGGDVGDASATVADALSQLIGSFQPSAPPSPPAAAAAAAAAAEAAATDTTDPQLAPDNRAKNKEPPSPLRKLPLPPPPPLPDVPPPAAAFLRRDPDDLAGVTGRIRSLEQSLAATRAALRQGREALSRRDAELEEMRNRTRGELLRLTDSLEFRESEMLKTRAELRSTRAEVTALEGRFAAEFRETRRVLEEKDQQLGELQVAYVQLRPTRVVWPNPGNEVLLTGSFNGWTNRIKMIKSNAGVFVTTLHLYPGQYEVKFIVDGNWKVDPRRPIIYTPSGHENNILVVT